MQGREIALYWAPESGPGAATSFDDGARLEGALAVAVDGQISTVGASSFRNAKTSLAVNRAQQTGRIVALDRDGLHHRRGRPGGRRRRRPRDRQSR